VIPGLVLDLLRDTPSAELTGVVTDQHECQGAKFHSPRPMIVHPFELPQSEGEIVYLCGTCADNVQVLLALLTAREGSVPWVVQRCFGNLARRVAMQAYTNSKEKDHA
jgi:hypothetical protein